EVGLGVGHELVGPLLGHDGERHPFGVGSVDNFEGAGLEVAVDADERRRADLDVKVGRPLLHHVAEQVVQIKAGARRTTRRHASYIGVCARVLKAASTTGLPGPPEEAGSGRTDIPARPATKAPADSARAWRS